MADVLGTIKTSLEIAKTIYDYAKEVEKYSEQYAEQVRQFNRDKIALENFATFFQSNGDEFRPDIQANLADASKALKNKLAKLKDDLSRSKEHTTWDRLIWPTKNTDQVNVLEYLEGWIIRMEQDIKKLPLEIQVEYNSLFLKDGYTKFMLRQLKSGKTQQRPADHDTEERKRELQEWYADQKLIDDVVKEKEGQCHDYFVPDGIKVPDKYIYNYENPKLGMEVARLVELLNRAKADTLHLPKALKYFDLKLPLDDQGRRPAYMYQIVYERPPWVRRTKKLKDALRENQGGGKKVSLSERVRIGCEITTAVAYLHWRQWVHEFICLDSILLVYGHDHKTYEQGGLGQSILFGFGQSRRSNAHMFSHGTDSREWTAQIYSHPDRQSDTILQVDEEHVKSRRPGDEHIEYPHRRYARKHDIYSLGVVLLSLCLWEDLETKWIDSTTNTSPLQNAKPTERRERLVSACDELPGMVGDLLNTLIRDCLKVDDTNIHIGQVLTRLSEVRV